MPSGTGACRIILQKFFMCIWQSIKPPLGFHLFYLIDRIVIVLTWTLSENFIYHFPWFLGRVGGLVLIFRSHFYILLFSKDWHFLLPLPSLLHPPLAVFRNIFPNKRFLLECHSPLLVCIRLQVMGQTFSVAMAYSYMSAMKYC